MASPKKPKASITLDELEKKANAGSCTDRELRLYFKLDDTKGKPFAPALRIDYAHVDTGGRQLPSAEVQNLYATATRERQKKPPRTRRPAAERAIRAAPVKPKILAEGDSWFNLPDLFMPKDAIDFLRQTYNVSNLAMWGDTMQNMLAQKQYVQMLGSGNFRDFLFSGGGNDVLGSIGRYVSPRVPGDTDPANAPNYVKPSFAAKVKSIITDYGQLADDVKAVRGSRTVLYVHGYANAIPKPNGRYLGRRLTALGFDPAVVGPLAEAIVAHMVAMFNAALQAFAASRANIVYLDLRPKVTRNDWYTDEIHPNAQGAKKISTAFNQAIQANVPVA